MVLFVKIVQKEKAFDFRKDFDGSTLSKENRGQPPLSVSSFVDFTNVL
jgi:hypothetical protein